MNLVISLGRDHPARIVKVAELTWQGYVDLLLKVQESEDKASRGWSCPVKFTPAYRDSENFQYRYALTFDYDRITQADLTRIQEAYATVEHLAYTTWSHTNEAPRWRYVFPLTRPVTYDEFQAISRKVAARAGIELAARESHAPSQMMYLPTCKPGQGLSVTENKGGWLEPDEVLAEYVDWTDKTQWPRRDDADRFSGAEMAADPTTKQGIVGAFCRAYTVEEAIVKFQLPYEKVR